jgi:hypothetical protein
MFRVAAIGGTFVCVYKLRTWWSVAMGAIATPGGPMSRQSKMRSCLVQVTAVTTLITGLAVAIPTKAVVAATPAPGTYVPLTSARLLDTGTGVGAAKAPVAAGGTVALQVTGLGGAPAAGAAAVVLNVTVATETTAGSVTAFPTGSARPGTPQLSHAVSQTVSNLVTVQARYWRQGQPLQRLHRHRSADRRHALPSLRSASIWSIGLTARW